MSNYLDFAIKDREALKQYIMRNLGAPLVMVEIADVNLDDCINDAVEYFTKYCSQEQDFLAVDLKTYVKGEGIQLPNNITGVFSLNDFLGSVTSGSDQLFSVSNVMLNAGLFVVPSYPDAGYGWVNWELFSQNLDLVKKMMGGGFQFQYNIRTQKLTLYPDPVLDGIAGSIVFGVHVIRPETQQYGEEWIKKYAVALAKIFVGRVRSKYTGTQLLAGASLDTRLLDEGIKERDELMTSLREQEQGPFNFWVG
jgi:hypothetical protein